MSEKKNYRVYVQLGFGITKEVEAESGEEAMKIVEDQLENKADSVDMREIWDIHADRGYEIKIVDYEREE